MDLITIDFETYYDKEFSLSKMTTEEYVRDPQFEVIGVGIKVNNGPTEWASGRHDEIKDYLDTFNSRVQAVTAEDIRKAFQKRINLDKMVTVMVGGTPVVKAKTSSEKVKH